ncbi:MAG: hypothetical protein ACQETO_00585 [Pseudomonadota bacterium]
MTVLHTLLFYGHIITGSVALPLFWIPVIARKGSFNHRRFGRWFARVMYAVAGTGLMMAGMDLVAPLALHAPSLSADTAEGLAGARQIRMQALFLFSLSVLVLASTRHGWLVINHRDQRGVLRMPLHVGLLSALLLTGLVLLCVGIISGRPLLIIFGMLESWLAVNMLHYSHKPVLQPGEWWIEHLGGLIVSGISVYTAFFVFGGGRLLEPLFSDAFTGMSIVLWVAPGVIGTLAISALTRRYRRRFSRGKAFHSS